jgi:hypothetical protein
MAGDRPGPPKGYKQSPDHIAKRCRFGEEHHCWVGDKVSVKSGRSRAIRHFAKRPCEVCGEEKKRIDRHHKDGNTANNNPENIKFLCRRCHMVEDGRMDKFIELAIENQPKAVDSRWK